MMNNTYKKRVALAIVTALCITAAWVGIYMYLHRPSTLIITTEPDAKISVALNQSEPFTEIGTGNAQYKTADLPKTVYVLVESSGKKSLAGVPMERGKNNTINLGLSSTIAAQKISDGAVLHAFFDGTTVQGIVPGDGSLTSYRTDAFATVRPEFVDLPFLNKIVWYDKDNFIYQTLEGSVGQFKDGGDLGTGVRRGVVSGTVASNEAGDNSEDSLVVLSDMAQYPGKPLVLMSGSNIFTSSDRAASLRAITDFTPNTKENLLFASESSIFRAITESGGDGGENEDEAEAPEILINEYDYNGKQLSSYNVQDDAPIVKVLKKENTVYVLTLANLYMIKSASDVPQKLGIYFGKASDMTLYKNSVVILGDDGLWKLSNDNNSLQLLYDYSATGIGLTGSLSVTPDARLIFGTEPDAGNDSQVGAIFSASF